MAVDIPKTLVFRIIPIQNLRFILQNGLYCKNANIISPDYVSIGSREIIDRRDTVAVKCFTGTVVNDFVPFYFSVRTPMLYNIVTGHAVPAKPQEEIIYLCFKLEDLATDDYQWCFTEGNAADKITRFFTDLNDLEQLDWHSIITNDFRANNADGDEDRIRKKHSEFLVKNHVPVELLKGIVVMNEKTRRQVQDVLDQLDFKVSVHINPLQKFYFL